MRSMWNPNRFLRSISPSHNGNPQPTRTFKRRLSASIFNSRNRAGRKVRPFKLFIAKSDPFWRQA